MHHLGSRCHAGGGQSLIMCEFLSTLCNGSGKKTMGEHVCRDERECLLASSFLRHSVGSIYLCVSPGTRNLSENTDSFGLQMPIVTEILCSVSVHVCV